MNRSEFLKKLGIGIAVGAIAGKVLSEKSETPDLAESHGRSSIQAQALDTEWTDPSEWKKRLEGSSETITLSTFNPKTIEEMLKECFIIDEDGQSYLRVKLDE